MTMLVYHLSQQFQMFWARIWPAAWPWIPKHSQSNGNTRNHHRPRSSKFSPVPETIMRTIFFDVEGMMIFSDYARHGNNHRCLLCRVTLSAVQLTPRKMLCNDADGRVLIIQNNYGVATPGNCHISGWYRQWLSQLFSLWRHWRHAQSYSRMNARTPYRI